MAIWSKTLDPDSDLARGAGTLAEALGIRIEPPGEDWIAGRMPVDHRTRQPFGLLHGGASVALAETLGSLGAWLTLPDDGSHAVGIEVNCNHLRAAREGTVRGVARPLHRGRSTQVWEIRIDDDAGRRVAVARLTLAVVAPARAAPGA